MTLDDTAAPTAQRSARPDADPEPDAEAEETPVETTTTPSSAQTVAGRQAFAWVDEDAIERTTPAAESLEGVSSTHIPAAADLLGTPPRRPLWRAGVVVPIVLIALVMGAYTATTLLWPLHAVPPTVEAAEVDSIAAAPAALTWPAAGSASIAVGGINGVDSSAGDIVPIASITKLVTALVVLDRMPLALGETGPEFRFGYADQNAYWNYRYNGESALDVPVGGSLTEYQMLEGMLIGSANNYADRLAGNLWPTDAVYADAANAWLSVHGVPGVTVVEPTGIDPRNEASPEALIALAKKAMAEPVIAEIVGKATVDLPGAGLVQNTNGLLVDPGVVGIKTGSLDSYNLLSAKDLTIGDTTVRVYSAVLSQPDDAARLAVSRALYADVEAALQPTPAVARGTVAGRVTTVWGEDVAIVTDQDADVILYDGGTGTVTSTFSLADAREKGSEVGTLSVRGPLDQAQATLTLADDIEPPSAWWRLTHPLDLFGLN